MIVTTLPITPKKHSSFVTLLAPFTAHLFARYASTTQLVACNVVGKRFDGMLEGEKEKIVEAYLENLEKIGVSTNRFWSEQHPRFRGWLRDRLDRLVKQGFLYVDSHKLLRCSCGAVEILKSASEHLYRKRLIVGGKGRQECLLCKTELEEEEGRCLLLRGNGLDPWNPDIIPRVFVAEANAFVNLYATNSLLVSRRRQTVFSHKTNGEIFFLDPDMVWSFMPAFIAEEYVEKQIYIVTSHPTLRQAVMSAFTAYKVDQSINVSVLVTPTINVATNPRSFITQRTMFGEFMESVSDPLVRRFFLANGLHWGSKEAVLRTSELYWITHGVQPNPERLAADPEESPKGIADFLSLCNQKNIRGLIDRLRKKGRLTPEETRLFLLLKQE